MYPSPTTAYLIFDCLRERLRVICISVGWVLRGTWPPAAGVFDATGGVGRGRYREECRRQARIDDGDVSFDPRAASRTIAARYGMIQHRPQPPVAEIG